MSTIAICMAKNEARYIDEWLAWHKFVGFGHAAVIDDGSNDGTPERVLSWQRNGFATLLRNTNPSETQMNVYTNALRLFIGKYDWGLFIDADELFVPECMDANKFVSEFPEDAGVIETNWAMFGNCGREKYEKGLMIEKFTKCSLDVPEAKYVKSFARLSKACHFPFNSHIPCNGKQFYHSCGKRIEVDDSDIVNHLQGLDKSQPDFAKARINHYYSKSLEEFEEKIARTTPDTRNPPTHDENRRRKIHYRLIGCDFEGFSLAKHARTIKSIMEEMASE